MTNPTDRNNPDDKVVAPGSEQARIAETQLGQPTRLPSSERQFAKTAEINPPLRIDSAYKSPEQAYAELPADRKSMMQLGLNMPHTDYEFKEGNELGSRKLIAITTNSPEASALLAADIISSGIALPLETPIIHGPDSHSNTALYLVPNPMNAHAITATSQRLKIPAMVRVSGHTQGIVRFSDQLIPIDPSLLAHTPVSSLKISQLQSAHWQPGSVQNYPISAAHAERPQKFGEPFSVSKYMAISSLQLAQKDGRIEDNITEETSYLIIDISRLLREPATNTQVENLLKRLASLSASPEFLLSLDQQGHLVILNRAQRGGSYMARLAAEIEKSTGGKSNMIVGKGVLKKQGQNYSVENYPDRNTIVDWERQGTIRPRTFLTQSTAQTLTSTRDATTLKFEVDAIKDSNLLALRDVKRSAKLQIGGPDKLVGYESELAKIKQSTDPISGTKLTIINGGAGSGKSRLANELLQDHPNALVHSVEASGENIPGSALAEMATTIKDAIDAKIPADVKQRHYIDIGLLKSYASKPEEQRLKEAQTSPQGLVEVYIRCLNLLEKTCGSFLLVVDDVHHIDRHSESYMMTMLERFLTGTQSKAMILRRPEETYHSVAQNNLSSNIRTKCRQKDQERGISQVNTPVYVESVNLSDPETGKPKLDIRDPKIAYEYAFHSLPVSLRLTETGEPRNLGNWPAELAKKCRTPFDFTSILNSLLEDESAIIVGADNISISPEKAQSLAAVNTDRDLLSYHQNRMRRLPDNAKKMLQCVAILGTKISLNNLRKIATEILEIDPTQVGVAIADLGKGGYIVQHEEGGFDIQHDNYRDIAISSLNGKEKRDLIARLYEQFQNNPEIHNDRKFALLCEISHDIPLNEKGDIFWTEYKKRGNQAMDDANRERAYGRGYSIGMTILNNLEKDENNTICKFLEILKINPTFDLPNHPPIKGIIIKALFSIAKNGLNLGNLSKTTEAIDTLELLEAEQFLTEAYIIGFKAAYLPIDLKTMEKFYRQAKDRADLNPVDDADMQIRLAFRKLDFNELQRLFAEHADLIELSKISNPQAYDGFKRIEQRIKFEKIRMGLENDTGVDGDVVLDPGHLTPEQTQEFRAILKDLETLNAERATNPDKFDPIQELQLRDQIAELAAFLGNYEEAATSLSEVWRIAQQMEISTEAARAAKSKGDIEVLQAIAAIEYPTETTQGKATAIPNGTIQRKHILKAIRTYTENGMSVLKRGNDPKEKGVGLENPYQLLIRGQRMRAVSILVRSYENEIASTGEIMSSPEQLKQELIPHLKTALEDFAHLNQDPQWGAGFKSEYNFYYSYYATSSMGHILQCIKDLGITEKELGVKIPDIQNTTDFPAFDPQSIESGIKYAAGMRDNLGETDSGKLPGFAKLINLGPNTEIFGQLRTTHQSVVTKRKTT